MATLEIRLLLLGAVALFEPVNGYQIRRELTSWRVDQWASVHPGSIYNGLATLTRQGSLQRNEIDERGRSVAVYELTDAGRDQLEQLIEQALATPTPYNSIAFHIALNMGPLLRREAFVAHLQTRLATLREWRTMTPPDDIPPWVLHAGRLQVAQQDAEIAWLEQTIESLAESGSGPYQFSGERPSWSPPPTDPGWQMDSDRQRYRRILRSRTPQQRG